MNLRRYLLGSARKPYYCRLMSIKKILNAKQTLGFQILSNFLFFWFLFFNYWLYMSRYFGLQIKKKKLKKRIINYRIAE